MRCLTRRIPYLFFRLVLGYVEPLVDWFLAREGDDLGGELLLDDVHGDAIVLGDHVDGQTHVAVAPRAPDAVKVGLRDAWEVEVDDYIDRLDVDTTGEQICKDCKTASEIICLTSHVTVSYG